jgi:hypothetical protein
MLLLLVSATIDDNAPAKALKSNLILAIVCSQPATKIGVTFVRMRVTLKAPKQ